MPRPSAVIGAERKRATKQWLESLGFAVAYMERVHWIQGPTGRIPTKRDQFGSDLLAIKADTLVFIQVKTGSGRFLDAMRKFEAFHFPPWSEQWVVAWQKTPRGRWVQRVLKRDPDVPTPPKPLRSLNRCAPDA